MIRIYVRKPGQITGRVYKGKATILNDRVAILGFIGFVATGFITEDEWAKSQERIVDRFDLYVVETKLDGRSKIARNIPYFSWAEVIKSNHYQTKYNEQRISR